MFRKIRSRSAQKEVDLLVQELQSLLSIKMSAVRGNLKPAIGLIDKEYIGQFIVAYSPTAMPTVVSEVQKEMLEGLRFLKHAVASVCCPLLRDLGA